jgi:RimJ/RimL family protein N-acetyltransferase
MEILQTLETERLLLRQWREADKEPFFRMNANPRVMEYFVSTLTREESDRMVSRIESGFSLRGYGLWAVEHKSSHDFMGFIGLNHTDFPSDFTPCTEIGWRLDERFWGRGYATEGARRCLDAAFRQLGLDMVHSFTSVGNVRSVKVMKNIGLTFRKEFDNPRIEPSHPLCRHVLYGLGKDDYDVTTS